MCGLLPTVAVAVLSLYRPAVLASLDYSVYDTLVRTIPARVPSNRLVIVDVDERRRAAVGQGPGRRDVIGQLIERLHEGGASVVALDVVFAERDRFEVAGGQAPDDLLAQTLRRGGVVLGYAMTFDGAHHGLGGGNDLRANPVAGHQDKIICGLRQTRVLQV